MPTLGHRLIQWVQVNVSQERADDPALRGPLFIEVKAPAIHDSGLQELSQEI
ncbi:hypothetical protein PA598K_02814 [Paenibacillus sp. 598K]|nr:hypothetical protein PA598K_02814 [Paenibacillus sp. 598K]